MSEKRVVVLGAGPSGLAVAACLRRRGLNPTILERSEAVGSTWRNHYRRLHLHTVKEHSALPGLGWPEQVPTYPARQDVVDYLEAYAAKFELLPRFGEEVTRVRREGDAWELTHTSGSTRADAVVVCTGYNRVPHEPTWPGEEGFTGAILHASKYLDGSPFRGKRALVVGAGNTGAEIALDLWEHGASSVELCIRGPVHVVPRDLLGLPAQITSLRIMQHLPPKLADKITLSLLRFVVGDLSRWGIRRPKLGPVSQVLREKQIPLIDVGTVALIRQGKIVVIPGIERFDAEGVHTVDGAAHPVDVVILATGYRAGIAAFLEESEGLLDERGYPTVFGAEAAPGLFFVGFRNPLTGQIHDIAREAERVAAAIAGGGR
ncbi:MAG: NAD(P)/FAD-dependent oxidoreductase [Myxococcales bacterium]|nr:NAD(P)/FAD-dependent oxidoreductase [Myxococcales bacterium]